MSIQTISSAALPIAGTLSRATEREAPAARAQAPVDAATAPPVNAPGEINIIAPSRERVQQALDEVRAAIEPVAQNLLFSIDDDTGRTIIKIIDSSTDEVIRQIPSEEILAIAKALDKLQGLLIKQEA